jgi:hypothetical protein
MSTYWKINHHSQVHHEYNDPRNLSKTYLPTADNFSTSLLTHNAPSGHVQTTLE